MKVLSYRIVGKDVVRHVFFVILCVILGYLEFRILWFIQRHNIVTILDESVRPLTGTSFWRAYQNRLLSGYVLQNLSVFFDGDTILSYQVFGLGLCVMINSAAYALFFMQTREHKTAFRYVIYGAFLFILFQDSNFFYAWDFLDVLFFVLLSIGIVKREKYLFFTLLFAVAIFNRESALFIPVWMCIDAIFKDNPNEKTIGRLLYSAMLLFIGIALVTYLRESLFVGSHIDWVGMDNSHKIVGNHFYLTDNIRALWRHRIFQDFDYSELIFSGLFVWILVKNWKKMTFHHMKVALLILLITCSNYCFSLVNETRVWFTLIPLILMYEVSFKFPLLSNNNNGNSFSTV